MPGRQLRRGTSIGLSLKGLDLHRILCIKTERTPKNDVTVAHDKKLYQIEEAVKTKKLMVEEYPDGSMAVWCRG